MRSKTAERKADDRQEKYSKASVATSRQVAERDQRDADLRDRDQALKRRELMRSERRQDSPRRPPTTTRAAR